MDLTREEMEQLRLGALTAIDGLWFLAAERKLGFDAALELDLEVWKDYGVVMLRRLARARGLELDPADPPGLEALNAILKALCNIDGTQCEYEMLDAHTSEFRVRRCSWWENLRRAGREKVVPCEMIDNTIFVHWLQAVDPAVSMEITRSMPRGHDHCAWILRRPPQN